MRNNTEPGYIKYLHTKAAHMGYACNGTFEITARCNFNCRMCYIHSSNINNTAKNDELSAEEWINIAREAAKSGLLFLLITGGEPLLREDFEEIYRKTREMGILVSVNTNGSLINDALLTMFVKYPPRRLNISLYGDHEDTYKNLCGVECFEKVKHNLFDLKKAGISVKLNMPATEYNKNDIGGIYKISEDLQFPLQATGYVFPAGRCENSLSCRLSPEKSALFDTDVIKHYKTEQEFAEYARQSLCSYTPLLNCDGEENSPCRAGKSSFWITWDGKMLPCGMLSEPFCEIRKEGFTAAWEKTKRETARITLPTECIRCKTRCVCSVCAAKCFCETGSFSKAPSYLCEISRKKYEIFQKHTGDTNHEVE